MPRPPERIRHSIPLEYAELPEGMRIKTYKNCEPYIPELQNTPAGVSPRGLAQALDVTLVEMYESISRDPTIQKALSNESYRYQILRYENVRDACLALRSEGARELTQKMVATKMGMSTAVFKNRVDLQPEVAEFFGIVQRSRALRKIKESDQ